MNNEKKFKFDAEQAELISQSFNDFQNDAIKAIAEGNSVGGKIKVHLKLFIKWVPGMTA